MQSLTVLHDSLNFFSKFIYSFKFWIILIVVWDQFIISSFYAFGTLVSMRADVNSLLPKIIWYYLPSWMRTENIIESMTITVFVMKGTNIIADYTREMLIKWIILRTCVYDFLIKMRGRIPKSVLAPTSSIIHLCHGRCEFSFMKHNCIIRTLFDVITLTISVFFVC